MAKLLLFTIVVAMVGLPVLAARDSNLQRGLKKVLLLAIFFNLFYLFAVRFVYPLLQ